MAKQRSVVSVHIDIAALVWATRGLNSDLEWAIWARSFVEALATQSPEKNQFAAQLIGDVIDFREKEAERIRNIRNVHVQNVQDVVQTVSKKESKTVSKSEIKKEEKANGSRFAPPTLKEVSDFCRERGNTVDPEKWMAHYTANGWKVGRNPMKSWKAAIVTWEKNIYGPGKPSQATDNHAAFDLEAGL